jgi:hypothetical protein
MSKAEINEPVAVDSFVDLSSQSSTSLASEAISIDLSLDPITEAIRTEILGEQRRLIGEHLITKEFAERNRLYQEAILGLSEEERATSQKEFEEREKKERADHEEIFRNPELFRAYCEEEENQEKIKEALKDASLKKALEGVEIDGYRNIHEQFDSTKYPGGFRQMSWLDSNNLDTPNVRQQIVRGDDDSELATLTETTHTNTPPTKVRKSDGTEVEIKNHRTIDFPTQLEDGKGPMHVSLAAKDENGHNIVASKAVYFTAHYDHEGKLSEISSPALKFRDNDPNAVAYIEHQGQIFTLPVTQQKYKEMMQEVAKNRGHGVDLSRALERSSDHISVSTAETKHQQEVGQAQESFVTRKISMALSQQEEFSSKAYLAAKDKPAFLKEILDSKLLPPNQLSALEEIIKNGGQDAAAEVVKAVAGSKYAAILTSQLLQGNHKGEVLKALAGTEEGKALLTQTYVAASETQRKDISELVKSNLTIEEQKDLTANFMASVVQPGKETIVTDLGKSDAGSAVLTGVAARSSTTLIEKTIKDVEKPMPSASIQTVNKSAQAELTDPDPITQAKAIKVALENPKPVVDTFKKTLSPEHITEMAKKLSAELEKKSTKEQEALIDKTLSTSGMSHDQQIKMLTELSTLESERRGKHILSATSFNREKDAAVRTSSPTKRKKDATGAEKTGQYEEEITVVGKTGGVGTQSLITDKIAKIKLKREQQAPTAAQQKPRPMGKSQIATLL